MAYIRALVSQHGLTLSGSAERAWQAFEDRLAAPSERSLRLEPHAQDRVPARFRDMHIDVHARGVDGRCGLYDLKDVTGVDERVQAYVASQTATAECLLDALELIETEGAHEFSFVCHGATHRSVACCILCAALAFPNATVHLTTRRTRMAAASASAQAVAEAAAAEAAAQAAALLI